jgi:hypothetical protein
VEEWYAHETGAPDDEDLLHDPLVNGGFHSDKGTFPWRGIPNVGALILLILTLPHPPYPLPVMTFFRNKHVTHVLREIYVPTTLVSGPLSPHHR